MKEQAVVKYLLRKFPDLAFEADSLGRLPIEVALTSGRTWYSGIRELVEANPNSLSQVDSFLGLYPYQLAARPGCTNPDAFGDDEDGSPRKKRRHCCNKSEVTSGATTLTEFAEENETMLHQVDTIFNLLRQCPCLVKFAEN